MSDDGSGVGIRIPSMLISKKDGLLLLDFIKTATEKELEQLSMVAKFKLHHDDNRVEYDIWLSSSNDQILDFIQDFGRIDKKFDESVLMTPHYSFWKCENCDEEFVSNNCFAKGAYCAHDSNHP